MDLPYTLDEATSSNDIMFMERASSGIIATNIAAGDFRSAFGARWFNDTFWVGAYVTGPDHGRHPLGLQHQPAPAPPSSLAPSPASRGRSSAPTITRSIIGGNAEWLIQPPHNLITGAQTFTLSDRPELRIDPTTLISTGAIAGVSGAQVYSVEAAATYRVAVPARRILLVQCRSQRDRLAPAARASNSRAAMRRPATS